MHRTPRKRRGLQSGITGAGSVILGVTRTHYECRASQAAGIDGTRSGSVRHFGCPDTLDGGLGASTVELRCLVRGVGHSLACSPHAIMASAERSFEFGGYAPFSRNPHLDFNGRSSHCAAWLYAQRVFSLFVALDCETADSEICWRDTTMTPNGVAGRIALPAPTPPGKRVRTEMVEG